MDEKLISQLFSHQPDSVVWFSPIFSDANESLVIDFNVRYCNAAASKILGQERSKIIGTTLLTSGLMDRTSIEHIFEQCLKVWNSGDPVEFTYYSPGFDKYFNVQRSKVVNGILSITRDRTTEVRAEQEREQQAVLLNKIINNSPTCIVFCQALRDMNSKIVDFALLMVNEKIANDLKRPKEEIQTLTYCTLHPAVRTNGLIDVLASVVETGERFNQEIYLEVFGGWFLLTVDKVDEDKIIATYLNINETKQFTEKLAAQAAWYNRVVRHSTNGIMAATAVRDMDDQITDLKIVLANPPGIQIADLPDDIVGKNLCEEVPDLRSSEFFKLHKKVIETGNIYTDTFLLNKGKRNGWFQVSLSKLDDGLVSNFVDITVLKEKEKTIEEQSHLLNLMLNSSINGVYTLDAVRDENDRVVDFIISHVNDIFCRMSGKQREELVGKSFIQTFPSTVPLGLFARNCRVLHSGKAIREELHYKGDNIDRWYDTSVNKVTANQIVIAFNDITPLKNAIHELQASNERLSGFTYVASHDLNEPLRKIITYGNLIQNRFGNEIGTGINGYLEKISVTAGRMQVLINDLLIYSQISNGKKQFENVSLNTIISEVQNDLERLIQEKKATIEADVLPIINADKTQLRQIFQNLISNSIKFQIPNKAPIIEIRYKRTSRAGKMYEAIAVKDNGIGFDQQHAEKIFHVFHRLHPKQEYEGTGIGLAIVQKAMENHSGIIEVHSKPLIGTTFELLFPLPD
ncbi:ATP-binding protein [Chryseosolibacter indicus]|uniref:histidine kinase n=1 Tax=Chryseosolibacter indicus TaxID=2782351 RepID=A0ABS5W0I7_9BACT|nr:ATP-binding protein [Chryseosolibacter indicus]MBT1705796.1 PAS domain-containing protein [Chryseosolibacter indicus]